MAANYNHDLVYGKTEGGTVVPLQVDADGVLQSSATLSGDVTAGTEYTEGDTDASITGGVVMWEDGSDTVRAVSAAKPLPVSLPTATVITLTPPAAITGFATAANQTTELSSLSAIDGHVDGIEGLLGTTNSSLSTIDGHVDGLETSVASIDTKTPALGQAVAGGSVPVVLPATQITTLTPPAAITGFATAAKQPALGTAGTPSTDVITVQGIASGVAQPISGTVDTELTTADLDTGAGTDTRAVVGLVLAESGGGQLVGSAHPMPVTPGAGELHLGEVSANLTLTNFTLVLDTNIYASGDVLSDTAAIASVFRVTNGKGILTSMVLNDEDDQGVALDVVFLDANVSLGTFNVAPAITDANARNILGIVSVFASDWMDLGGVRVAAIPANRLGFLLKAASATTSLFIATITRGGTPTYTASGITGRIGVECN